MINEHYKTMLGGKSVIRSLSEYATARGAAIGYDNVYDYSLGNPSVPCPPAYTDATLTLHRDTDPVALHGYSPSLGIPSVRKAIADSLDRRFGMDYTADHGARITHHNDRPRRRRRRRHAHGERMPADG